MLMKKKEEIKHYAMHYQIVPNGRLEFCSVDMFLSLPAWIECSTNIFF